MSKTRTRPHVPLPVGPPLLAVSLLLIAGLVAVGSARAQTCPAPCVTSYPYTEDFEAGFGNFSNAGGDDIDWTRNSGPTPSSGTGPSADHTTGGSAGYYLYTEATDNGNMTALLDGPCLDLSGSTDVSWTFWYHMYGSAMGTLYAEIAPGCGSGWTAAFSASGDHGDTYLQANIDLSAYAGSTVKIRFRGVTGTGYTSDMAIDDISVNVSSEISCADDADCDDGLFCNGAESCLADVCQVHYPPCSAPGWLCDELSDTCTTILLGPDDFETGAGNWSDAADDDIDWTRNSGPTSTNSTGPSADHTTGTSAGYYLYTEASGSGIGYPNMTALLNGPCLDLSGTARASLTFWYHMYGAAMGTLYAEIAPGCGSSWTTTFTASGDLGDTYLQANIDLSAYAGSNVKIRFRGVTGTGYTSDMAIDDVVVTGMPDGDLCTVDADCNDGNPCTSEVCTYGVCGNPPLPDDSSCLDSNVCNGAETCQAGVCTPGTTLSCNDSNVCTADSCDAVAGCINSPLLNGTSCSDGNVCNGADTCQSGTCAAGTVLNCDDGNVCTTNSCDPAFGCTYTPVLNGTPCPDGNLCNGSETCQAGVCTAGAELNCNDSNVCTADSCDAALGCQNASVLNGTPCGNGDVCDGNETCQSGVCTAGTPPNCNDGNACTTDSCAPVTGCQNTPVANGSSCTDGNVCNGGETCQAGVCTAGTALDCDDDIGCTVDTCDPVTGCDHAFIPGCRPCQVDTDCVDGNLCTADVCGAGVCSNPVLPDGTDCGDGDVCNGMELCQAAVCELGTPLDCDDSNQCTSESCDPILGCASTQVADGTPCDIGDLCNGKACQGGVCLPGPPLPCDDANECTDDSCVPATGCVSTFNSAWCEDGLFCTVGEICSLGVCGGGGIRDCTAYGDACNVGVCNEETDACERIRVNEGEPCFGGDPCVGNETCIDGVCGGGTPLDRFDCFSARVFVTNSVDDTLSVIRTSDFAVEITLDTGLMPAAVAVDAEAGAIYVTNNIDNTVTVISLADYSLVATIPTGAGPVGAAVTPSGQFVYVANSVDDSISVISTMTNAVTATIDFDPVGILPPFGPTGVTVTPDGDFVYVTNNSRDSVSVVRTIDNSVTEEIPVGRLPHGIAASPDGSAVYVAHSGSNTVGVISTAENAVIGTISVGAEPTSIAFTPDGEFAYVSNSGSDTVSMIRTSGNPSVVANIAVGELPAGLAVTATGDSVYVANTGSDSVSYHLVGEDVSGAIDVGASPSGVAVEPQPVFSLAGSASPTPVRPGDQLTLALTYSNRGVKSASNVVISATIPANSTFVSATNGGVMTGTEVVEWTIGQLPAHASGEVSFILLVDNPLPPGTVVSSSATMVDDQAVTAQTVVSANVESNPVYALAKVDDADPVPAGGTLTYTITYASSPAGNSDGQGVIITETYDPNVTFLSASPPPAPGTDNQWVIGLLPVGASGTIMVTVVVDMPLPNGTIIQNHARLTDAFGASVTAAENTTVQSSPLFAIGIGDAQDPTPAGTRVNYSISYMNSGNNDASGAVVRTSYDSNLAFVSAMPLTDLGTTDTWSLGNLEVGASGVIIVTLQVADVLPNGTIVRTQATITDSGSAFATASESTTVSSGPTLNLTIADSPDPTVPGDTLTYTITYANSGTDVAPGTSVLATYDPGTTFLSAVPPPAVGNNQWNTGYLPVGASGIIVVSLQVNAPLGSIVTGQAVISDTRGNSSSASENTSVQATGQLTLTMTDSVDPIAAGGLLTYTLQYGNSGNSPATNTVLTAVYDPHVTFFSSVPQPDPGMDRQWTVGTVNNGVSGEIFVTVRVHSPLESGSILTSQAAVTADGGVLATASQNTTIESEPRVFIFKLEAVDPTPPGQNLSYRITYSNPGNDNTSGVVITEAYDPLVSFVSAVPPPDEGTNNKWTIGDLLSGQGGTIDVTVAVPMAPNGTTLTNLVTITDGEGRSAAATTSTTARSRIFGLELADDADTIGTMATVEFRLTYENVTQVAQHDVVASSAYDARFVVNQITPAADAGTDNVWTLGTLAPGQTGTIVVSGFFTHGEQGVSAITNAQIANGNGAAFASETTVVLRAPVITRQRLRVRRAPRSDSWRLFGSFTPTGQLNLEGQEVSVSVVGPGGVSHMTPLVLPELETNPRGRWRFVSDVPGSGRVRLRLRQRPGGQWLISAHCKGTGIVPTFPSERDFQVVVTVGSSVFVSEPAEFRESTSGLNRRYP